MKVKEHIEKLQEVDSELDVYVPSRLSNEYYYGLVYSSGAQLIAVEDSDQEEEEVFVIEEV